MKQDERCTRCGGEIFPNAGEQWPDGWIHSEPNNCYLTALARAEAAEALAYERLENMLFAEQRATDADLRAEAAEAEAADAILAASDAAQREENAMHALSHFRTRVAELEAALAAQGWRPVTEEWPPYDKCVPVRMRNGAIRWGFRRGDFWHLTVGKYGREGVTHAYVLPPAPQETE